MKKWNLDALYKSFKDKDIQNDFDKIDYLSSEINKVLKSEKKDVETILSFYNYYNDIQATTRKLHAFASLNLSADTKNESALNMLEKVEKYQPTLNDISVSFSKFLVDVDGETLDDKRLDMYRFNILENMENAKYMLSEKEEKTLSAMKASSSLAFSKLHDLAVSSLMCEYEGEILPISTIRNLAYSGDADVRKKAYESELKALETIDYVSAASLNAIKGEIIYEAKLRSYLSPLDMTLIKSRMNKATLDALLISIEEYLPIFRDYLKTKAKLLGHDNGLPFYDLFAPIGKSNKKYSYEEASEFVVKHFSTFNKKLGDFAQNAFDKEWIDPFPRQNKVAGAFCSNLPFIKESRILSNFTGSYTNVSTLAHELGHAYHGHCLNKNKMVNTSYPMPLAETASIFCETIVENAALASADKEEKLVILENTISKATQVIVDIYSRFLFEKEVFELRKNGSISVEKLNQTMLDAQKKAYGDGLDENYLHKYMWIIKPHYYFPARSYYNFPYAFGILFAKGLYSMYLKEGDSFLEKYDTLLNYTGDHNIKEVLASVGVDSENPDFFRSSLNIIKKSIEEFVEVCNDK